MIGRRVVQFLKAIRAGVVQEVPLEYQACESCRETSCNTEKASSCKYRVKAEQEERSRRESI